MRVAFSASLTSTPPKPRNPPSFDASATLLPICSSQALYAAASEAAFWSTIAATARSASMNFHYDSLKALADAVERGNSGVGGD